MNSEYDRKAVSLILQKAETKKGGFKPNWTPARGKPHPAEIASEGQKQGWANKSDRGKFLKKLNRGRTNYDENGENQQWKDRDGEISRRDYQSDGQVVDRAFTGNDDYIRPSRSRKHKVAAEIAEEEKKEKLEDRKRKVAGGQAEREWNKEWKRGKDGAWVNKKSGKSPWDHWDTFNKEEDDKPKKKKGISPKTKAILAGIALPSIAGGMPDDSLSGQLARTAMSPKKPTKAYEVDDKGNRVIRSPKKKPKALPPGSGDTIQKADTKKGGFKPDFEGMLSRGKLGDHRKHPAEFADYTTRDAWGRISDAGKLRQKLNRGKYGGGKGYATFGQDDISVEQDGRKITPAPRSGNRSRAKPLPSPKLRDLLERKKMDRKSKEKPSAAAEKLSKDLKDAGFQKEGESEMFTKEDIQEIIQKARGVRPEEQKERWDAADKDRNRNKKFMRERGVPKGNPTGDREMIGRDNDAAKAQARVNYEGKSTNDGKSGAWTYGGSEDGYPSVVSMPSHTNRPKRNIVYRNRKDGGPVEDKSKPNYNEWLDIRKKNTPEQVHKKFNMQKEEEGFFAGIFKAVAEDFMQKAKSDPAIRAKWTAEDKARKKEDKWAKKNLTSSMKLQRPPYQKRPEHASPPAENDRQRGALNDMQKTYSRMFRGSKAGDLKTGAAGEKQHRDAWKKAVDTTLSNPRPRG